MARLSARLLERYVVAVAGLVVGAEGNGLSRLVRETCDFIAELPMPGGFESLNAGVAAGIALYEILRQRTSPLPPNRSAGADCTKG